MTQKEIMNSFADVYWSALPHYRKYSETCVLTKTSKRFRSEFYQSLKWLLKHCGTLVPPKASEAALNIAEPHGVDLFALQWKDQKAAEEVICEISGRNLLIHEHEIPVSSMYDKIISAEQKEDILDILMNQSIVWITRDEEKKLHQYIRDRDAYSSVGIIIRENPYGDNWMEETWFKIKTNNLFGG